MFGLMLENSLPSSCPKREAVLAKLFTISSKLPDFLPSSASAVLPLKSSFVMFSAKLLAFCWNSLAFASASCAA